MSIKKPAAKANLGPRSNAAPTSAAPVSAAFTSVAAEQAKLTTRIDANLHRRFKLAATAQGVSMGEVIETLVAEWVKDNEH